MRRLGIAIVACWLVAGWCQSAVAALVPELITLQRVDGSGVYALPAGARLEEILLDGQPTAYVLLKDGSEVDVWGAQADSVVEAIIVR